MVGWLVPLAEQLMGQALEAPRITSVRRSPALQARLYRRFLAGTHPYPVAPPGRSLHEHGLAWDMIASDGELRRLGQIWERMGGRWGGRFRDNIHFEAGPRMLTAHRVRLQPVSLGVSAGGKPRQAASASGCSRRGRCAKL